MRRSVVIGIAVVVGVAVWAGGDRPPASIGTASSRAGEARVALRGWAQRVEPVAAKDPAVARAFAPLRAAIMRPTAARAAAAFDRGVLAAGLGAPPVKASELADAEARLAALAAEVGEPLPTALLAQVTDPRAEAGLRALLMRILACRWPERLAPELVPVLEHEPRLTVFAEAAIVAGKLASELPDLGLEDALAKAVGRARGWGRQYPIAALVLAGDTDRAAIVGAALTDKEPAVRRHAATYLAWAGHMSWLAKLDQLSRRDPDATTRRVAQEAVARLIGIRLAATLSEPERRARLDEALLPRLAMHRPTVH